MDELKQMRNEIDEIDDQMVELFQRRMAISKRVAEYKLEHKQPVQDKNREADKLDRLGALADNNFNKHGILELYRQLMAMSRKLQYRLLADKRTEEKFNFKRINELKTKNCKVIYQGVPGAYSYAAMLKFFGEEVDCENVATFKDAMDTLSKGAADYAVLPFENSTAGMVADVYDLLGEYDHKIVAETAIRINHALLGLPDAELSDIKRVYSHPQALMQSGEYLNEHKQWDAIRMPNTAVSAKKILEKGDKSNAAIASITAAKIYGLKVLQEHLNVSNENTTRFIIVSPKQIYQADAGKVLVAFEVPHYSGSLYNMLSNFIYNNVNMCKIESRPIKGENWRYRFFVEIEGNLEDNGVVNALYALSSEAVNFKVLGCY